MSDKEETVAPEDFIDPNSGRAAQPGAFASMGVQPEPAGQDVGANVPENDPELPAKTDDDLVPDPEGPDNGEDPGAASEVTDDNVAEENVVPENAPESLAGQVDPEAEGSQEIETEVEPGGDNPRVPQGDAGADGADATEDKDYSELLSGNVKDVEAYLEKNPEEKDAVIAAEKQGQARKGIVNL